MIINEKMYNKTEREYLLNLVAEALQEESIWVPEELSKEDIEAFRIDEDELKPLEKLLVAK